MNKVQGSGAVLYVRVSTDDQANGPLNLTNQETRCRDFCTREGWPVIAVFVDPGESARSADRPEFQKMLAFCMKHQREVRYVVVQDLSRFARNVTDQGQAIGALRNVGVSLQSTHESNIGQTAAGIMSANIYGTFNQYFSDALSERMQVRTRQSVAAGRFPWRAPLGYLNIGGKDGANIRPDQERAPKIRRAFELMATGGHRKTEVLRIVTDEGLVTARGNPLTQQTFQAILRNPIYAGWVTLKNDESLEPVRGLHEPIITQELFDRVQAILDGRKPSAAPKHRFNPELPLKCLIKCEACNTPLTGGLAQGRSKKYGHYWCRKKGCRAVKLSSAKLEAEFLEFLGRLRLSPEIVASFPKIAAKAWEEKQGDGERTAKRLRATLEKQTRLKSELPKAKLRGEISQTDYEQANAEFSVDIAMTTDQLETASSGGATMEAFLRFAELLLVDMAGSWQMAAPEHRPEGSNSVV
jgi:site-specific DNA recombinase